MQKRGAGDVRAANRGLIMSAVVERDASSRIELARETGLSPSTISGLVSDLIGDGILEESGAKVSTAGRSRTQLRLRASYGLIAVVEISRTASRLYCYDMALDPLSTSEVSSLYLSGNELLAAISTAILKQAADGAQPRTLRGIGLLFQDDMSAAEFNVMYSTGFSSASISLHDALVTQFRVPVSEEYTQAYTVRQALAHETPERVANHAHLSVGSTVLLDVTQAGASVSLHDGPCADVAPLMAMTDEGADVMRLLSQGAPIVDGPSDASGEALEMGRLTDALARVVLLLGTVFRLDALFLSGRCVSLAGFKQSLEASCKRRQDLGTVPALVLLDSPDDDYSQLSARSMRHRLLCSKPALA
jgi:hypothetical protein